MRSAVLAVTLLSFLSLPASAVAIHTVNDLGDAPDQNPGDTICATAGGVCTLRAAIQEGNANADFDSVNFSVTGVIQPATPLPAITDDIAIDATETGYTGPPRIILDGAGALPTGINFSTGSDTSSLYGLEIRGFTASGVNVSADTVMVQGNYLGAITGGLPNFDGITLFGNGDFVIDNVISGNARYGVLATGASHAIRSNRIGTNAAGTAALPNGEDGIHVFSLALNLIIGDFANVPAQRNLIAFNGDDGIDVDNSSNVAIGDNIIRDNAQNGVTVRTSATGVAISASSIHDNGAFGIDLGDNGVTMNDPLDLDSGANTLQNFPVITAASGTNVSGTLNSTPSTQFRIRVYTSPSEDPSHYGEGAQLVGTTTATTDALGNATFSVTTPALTAGTFVTATATLETGGFNGNTSEFSLAYVVQPPASVQFNNATYSVNENAGSITITVNRTGDTSGTTTVSYATSNGSATAGSDYTATSGILTFAPGVTSQQFVVPITNDATDEPNETVNLALSGASVGTPGTAVLTIVDDDAAPAAVAAVPTLSEWALLALVAMLAAVAAFKL